MRVVEVIQLRSVSHRLETLSDQIIDALRAGDREPEFVAIYRRNGLQTDLAIHIHGCATAGTAGPSDVGVRLASALKAYGLVEHSVWEKLR